MAQLTLRIDDDLAARVKAVARVSGRSVNAFAALVLSAAVDPDLATDEAERLRERLDRAGVLAPAPAGTRGRPDEAALARARAAAASGRPLAELIREGRS